MRRIRNEPAVLLLAGVAASVASPPSAGAQAGCAELEWRDGCALPFGFDSDLRAVASLDHDGDGVASLFAAGAGGASGASFEGLAHFVDGAWRPFGGQFFGRASKIAVADLDGDGTASLIVLGALRFALDGTIFGLLEWNGSAWVGRVPGWGLEDAVVLDDDGDGTDTLFASAWYPDASLPSWIVRWNGTGWQSLSTACTITPGGFNPSSIPLAAFDSDGDGREELFATAVVSAGGVTIASGMARWDGSTWSDAAGVAPPALLTSGTVRSMCVADVDGDGDAELVAGGELANVPAGSAPQVVAYDGKSWSGVGDAFVRETPGVAQANIRLVSSARVGRGGEPALFAAGSFTRVGATPAAGVVRWDGSAWTGVGWGTTAATQGPFQGLFGHDPDGDADFELVGFGNFITIGSSIVNRVASFDGDAWGPLGLTAGTIGLNGSTRDSAWFDHDGDGHRSLVVAGSPSIGESTGLRDFTSAGDVVVSGLAVLDGPDGQKGFGWQALGHPWPKGIEALLVADLDGDGVESLYAAGNTGERFAPSVEARSIAFFTPTGSGGIWTPLPGRFGGYVETLAAIDHDLDGAPSLFVGGLFSQVDSLAVGRLARWDGAAWQRSDPGPGGQLINAVVSFDDDGDGLPSMIVAIGNYDPYSWFHRVRKWTGSAWVPLGAVTQGHVLALQAFDHDGDGVASLFAFGQASTPGGIAWAQRWHAGAWTPFGPVVDFGWTQAGAGMFAFDDDGDGASSVFMHTTDPFSGIHGGLYRAMGDGWVEVAARLAGGASRARVADPDGDGRASVYLDGGLRARPGTSGSGIGIIDACVAPCPADLDADGLVGALDLAALLSGWGACGAAACPGDLDAGGSIDAIDLALLLGAWGDCP